MMRFHHFTGFLLHAFFLFLFYHDQVTDDVQAELVEPWVSHLSGVVSAEDCQRIIQAAEQIGFPEDADTIDYNAAHGSVSWQIDVEENGEILEATIDEIYQPYLPIVNQIVSEHKIQFIGDHTAPSLDWVFLRKYQAGSKRRMLSLHSDVNLFTVIVSLNSNEDFEGGGLFYVKPDTDWELDADGAPELPDELDSHEFLSSLKRANPSRGIVFPDFHTGDLLIHNFTLYHAIAPLESGTRYSLIFFYDESHPYVAHLNEHDVNVTLMNYWLDEPASLYWIDPDVVDRTPILALETIPKKMWFTATSDDAFEVKSKRTGKLLLEFSVPTELSFDGTIRLKKYNDDYDDYMISNSEENEDDYDESTGNEDEESNQGGDSAQEGPRDEDTQLSKEPDETNEDDEKDEDDDDLHDFVFIILDDGEKEQALFSNGEDDEDDFETEEEGDDSDDDEVDGDSEHDDDDDYEDDDGVDFEDDDDVNEVHDAREDPESYDGDETREEL
jgi:hypothetical protein